jgi:ABC-type spermidine/putrescine transport system permease subunit II
MSAPRPYAAITGVIAGAVMSFVLLPVVFIVLYAFNQGAYLTLPPKAPTLRWFESFFANRRFVAALWSSLGIAGVVTPVAMLVAVPTARALVRHDFPGKATFNAILLAPLIVPGVITGIAFLSLSSLMGIGSGFWPLAIALLCYSLPFAVRALVANMHGLDPTLEDAARNLGASGLRAFLWVTLPQLRPGLLAGGIFVFVEAIDNFSIAVFLTDTRTTTLPVEAYSYIRDFDDPTVAAMAVLLMALSVTLVSVVDRLVGLDRFLELR